MICNDQKILGINTIFNSLNYKGFVKDEFRSNTSFLDYDAVIIDTRSLSMKYEHDYPSTYAGKRLIGKDESQLMIEDFARVKTQIIELLKQGKNVFILMSHNENCYVHTGRTEYSGTGKNARGTNIVVEFDTFSFLPVDLKPTLVSGEDFKIACQPPYSTFFNSAKELIYYDAYFDVPAKNSLLKIPNSEKSISAVFEYEKGKVIILPCVCDKDWFEDEKAWKKIAKKYLEALCELNRSLISSKESYKLPMWSEGIKILDEEHEEKKLQEEMTKLKNIEEKIKKRQLIIDNIKKKKILITATGEVLEEIVKETLEEIGFSLQKQERGRSDVVASYDGRNVVAEIKGVSKSAAEKHAAQLEKWVAQFIDEQESSPKAILIINGYCDTPLSERSEEVFPDQMMKYCVAREHALITTTQLLCMYIDIKRNPSCAKERIQELLSCIGKYNRYLDCENYLKFV